MLKTITLISIMLLSACSIRRESKVAELYECTREQSHHVDSLIGAWCKENQKECEYPYAHHRIILQQTCNIQYVKYLVPFGDLEKSSVSLISIQPKPDMIYVDYILETATFKNE